MRRPLYTLYAGLAALLLSAPLQAGDIDAAFELESGALWQSRNKVRIPNDASADRFALTDIAGSGPWPALRINANWRLSGPHELRLVIAPLAYKERGSFSEDVRFDGETFAADTRLAAEYQFNSYRLGYRYRFEDVGGWRLWLGATAFIRDAKIELTQGSTKARDDDLGFVPLLYLAGEYRFAQRWSLRFDFDGLAGGPGRALDLGVKLGYDIDERWRISAGYRTLEGGVDTDDVYNFAWFNTALLAIDYRLPGAGD